MANVRLIRRRIISAKNISQITKAMELVAASKMKKAQLQALAGKLYAQKIYDMVMRVAERLKEVSHPLLTSPQLPTGKKLALIITTNKGLCGGLNTGLFRYCLREIADLNHYSFITLGKKGARFVAQSGWNVIADFSDISPFSLSASAVNDLIVKEFLTMHYDAVDIIYNEFITPLKQQPRKKTILPVQIEGIGQSGQSQKNYEYLIEPSIEEVFNSLIPHYIENQVRDAILQAQASEHSARMVAMRNATDNARSLVYDLTLMYNKARQEKITYEISDMVTARLAVEV